MSKTRAWKSLSDWVNAVNDVCVDECWSLIETWDAKELTATVHFVTIK